VSGKQRLYPGGILILALVIRLAFVLAFPQPEVAADAWQYITIGWNLASGHGYSTDETAPFTPTAYRAPLYPSLLAVIFHFIGRDLTAVRLVQTVLGALAAVVTFYVGRETTDDWRVGTLAALIFAVYPAGVFYCGYILVETTYTFLLSLAVLFFVRAVRRDSRRDSALSGALLGLTALTRPAPLLFPLVALAVGLLVFHSWHRTLVHLALITGVMAVVLLPWTVRNYLVFDAILPVVYKGMGSQLWLGNRAAQEDVANPDEVARVERVREREELTAGLTPVQAQQKMLREGLKEITHDPGWYAHMVIAKVIKLWRYPIGGPTLDGISPLAGAGLGVVYFGLLLTALVGLAVSLRRWRDVLPLLSVLVYFVGLHGLLHAIPRYHLPLLPYVFVLASVGLWWMRDRVQGWRLRSGGDR
jgi:4-amino-4-deoxy-L-arabinose transferase-like glycosyltransferase